MSDGKYEEDVLVLTAESWHGKEDLILPRGTSVEDGTAASGMEDIVWELRPLYVEVEPGKFVPFGDKQALTRLPNLLTSQYGILDTRVVRDYEIVNNDFLIELAVELAEQTGWTFEGCGTLQRNRLSFIQLRLDQDYYAAGREYERHAIRFLYGDDKGGGSGFVGLNYKRVQCQNTWKAAIAENTIMTVSHRDAPEVRWKLLNAQAIEVVKAVEEQNIMLDLFYFRPVDDNMVGEFVERTFPLPSKPSIVTELEQAEELVKNGIAADIDLAPLYVRGERAKQRHASEVALTLRRRNAVEVAFKNHNENYPDSANTLYALFQALTYVANHSDTYRGDAVSSILFGGKRGQDIDRGYAILVEMLD